MRLSTAYGVTDRHGADGARRGLAENERYLRGGGRGLVGVHAAFTCSRRDARGGRRPGPRPRRRRAHPRRRGPGRRRRRGPPRAPRAGRLAARPLRAPRPPAARHDRPQPALEHEQRGRLRPSGTVGEPGGARDRRHRRRHARRGPPRLRRAARRRSHRRPGHGVVVARRRLRVLPRGARRPGDVELRPRRQRLARRVHPGDAAPSTSSAATARCCCATACRRASTSTRSAPRPPSRPGGCSPASDGHAGQDGTGCSVASVAGRSGDARRPRGLRRARGDARRAGRVRRLLHDRRRHVGVTWLPRLRPADDERDGRQRGADGRVDRHPADRRRRHRLRQRAERHPHRARVRGPRRRRPAHRGPGVTEALRPPRRQGGDPRRRVRLQGPCRRGGPPR